MYKLRNYQNFLIDSVFTSWNKGNRSVMLQLPTGAGKTIIFAEIINRFLKQTKKAMIIAHRRELIRQAAEKVKNITGQEPSIILSGEERNLEGYVQVASIQTLIRLKEKPQVNLLVFDEAHHTVSKSYTDIIKEYPNALILGVTATPLRIDGHGFSNLYDDLIIGPSIVKLIEQEYLSEIKMFAAVSKINTQGIQITAGDFNLKELSQAVAAQADITGDLVTTWKKYAEGKKTILFAVDVAHSKKCAKAFNSAGIAAEHIDGKIISKHRDEIINKFRSGEILVLCNCNIVSEGFDIPNVEAIQCVRPTLSLVFYMQMFGRALRPHKDKKYAILIDHTHNWSIHGLPHIVREWSLEPKPFKTSFLTQECPKCHHIFQLLSHEFNKNITESLYLKIITSFTICPNCQHEFQFIFRKNQNIRHRNIILDLLEEYGQVKEIAYINKDESCKDIKNYLDSNSIKVKEIRKKYNGLRSVKKLVIKNCLEQEFALYIYGELVSLYGSIASSYKSEHEESNIIIYKLKFREEIIELTFEDFSNEELNILPHIEQCYSGIAILEGTFNNSKFQLPIAKVTIANVIPNHELLSIILSFNILDDKEAKLIIQRIERNFCYAIKLKNQEIRDEKRQAKLSETKRKMEKIKELL